MCGEVCRGIECRVCVDGSVGCVDGSVECVWMGVWSGECRYGV